MNDLVPVDIAAIGAAEMRAAIAQSEHTKDMTAVWDLLQPVVADTARLSAGHVLALVLFTLAMGAAKNGDESGRHVFLQTMRENCSRPAIDSAVLSTLLRTAADQNGWLDPAAYDDLAVRITRLPETHKARLLFATIQRHPRPPTAQTSARTTRPKVVTS